METKVCTLCKQELESIRFCAHHKVCNPCRWVKYGNKDSDRTKKYEYHKKEDYKKYMRSLINIRMKRVWHYGYTWNEFVEHMESLFLPGMTWDNWGKGGWSLSHRVSALSLIRQNVDLCEVNALSNIFPQWEKDNQREIRTRVK